MSGVCPPNCTIDALELAVGLLFAHDLEHVLFGQRLEIEAVRGVVVGRDRLRIAVDHDGLVAGVGQREGRVAAAIVELDALADAVRAAAKDDDLLGVGGPRLALRRPGEAAPHRSNTCRPWARRTRRRRCRCACRPGARRAPGVAPQPRSPRAAQACRAARRRSPWPSACGTALALCGRPCSRTRASISTMSLICADEPGVDLAGLVDLLLVEAEPERLRHFEEAVGRGGAERRRGSRSCRRLGQVPRTRCHRGRSGPSPSSAAPFAATPGRCGRWPWPRPPISSRW